MNMTKVHEFRRLVLLYNKLQGMKADQQLRVVVFLIAQTHLLKSERVQFICSCSHYLLKKFLIHCF